MSLSEEMFDKLSKKDMWRMYSESVKKEEEMLTKIKADTTAVLERLSATEDRLVKVESELAIVKHINRFLKNEISRVQTQQLKETSMVGWRMWRCPVSRRMCRKMTSKTKSSRSALRLTSLSRPPIFRLVTVWGIRPQRSFAS